MPTTKKGKKKVSRAHQPEGAIVYSSEDDYSGDDPNDENSNFQDGDFIYFRHREMLDNGDFRYWFDIGWEMEYHIQDYAQQEGYESSEDLMRHALTILAYLQSECRWNGNHILICNVLGEAKREIHMTPCFGHEQLEDEGEGSAVARKGRRFYEHMNYRRGEKLLADHGPPKSLAKCRRPGKKKK